MEGTRHYRVHFVAAIHWPVAGTRIPGIPRMYVTCGDGLAGHGHYRTKTGTIYVRCEPGGIAFKQHKHTALVLLNYNSAAPITEGGTD